MEKATVIFIIYLFLYYLIKSLIDQTVTYLHVIIYIYTKSKGMLHNEFLRNRPPYVCILSPKKAPTRSLVIISHCLDCSKTIDFLREEIDIALINFNRIG